MTGNRDVRLDDEMLRSMLQERYDVTVPRDLLAPIVAGAQRTRQRRSLRSLSPGPFAPPLVRIAWHGLLLALVLALAAGAFLVGAQLLRDRAPQAPAAVWQRVEAAAFQHPDGALRMAAAATRGETLVAVGSGPDGAEVWTSRSGAAWTRLGDREAFEDAAIHDVSAWDGGFLAVGGRDRRCAAWRSADGEAWVGIDLSGACARGTLTSVASRGTTIVAAGDPGPGVGDGEPEEGPVPATGEEPALVLVSDDADTWHRARGLRTTEIGVVPVLVADGSRWTIMSRGSMSTSSDGQMWESAGGGPELDPRAAIEWRGALVVGGTAREGAEIARHQGDTWERAAAPPAVGGSIVAFAGLNDGLIAAGDGPDGALVWTSLDGAVWTRAEVRVRSGARVRDLVVAGSRVVAIGDSGRGAAVWESTTEARP